MKKNQILAAWRDEEYLLSLSAEERAQIPEHPAGALEVEDDILQSITGGCTPSFGGGSCPTSGYCTPCALISCSA